MGYLLVVVVVVVYSSSISSSSSRGCNSNSSNFVIFWLTLAPRWCWYSEKEVEWCEGESSEDEAAYDEDDENAENNWRNDYPDDDPMYFERLHLDDNCSSDDDREFV